MANAFDSFVTEAEAFFAGMFNALESAFGAGTPMTNALGDLATKLKGEIESVKVVVDGVEQMLVPTSAVWNQVMAYIGNVKSGVLSGPMASNWLQWSLKVLSVGVPIALEVLSGAGPVVTLGEETLTKLLTLL